MLPMYWWYTESSSCPSPTYRLSQLFQVIFRATISDDTPSVWPRFVRDACLWPRLVKNMHLHVLNVEHPNRIFRHTDQNPSNSGWRHEAKSLNHLQVAIPPLNHLELMSTSLFESKKDEYLTLRNDKCRKSTIASQERGGNTSATVKQTSPRKTWWVVFCYICWPPRRLNETRKNVLSSK